MRFLISIFRECTPFCSPPHLNFWVVNLMPTAVLGVDILSGLTTSICLPVEHITYFVEYWGWSSLPPGECGVPHPAGGITSSQCPHGDQCCIHQSCAPTVRTCAAPPPPRRVPPPAPRASAAGRRNVAKLARSLAAEHMPSVARGYLVGDCEDKMDKDLQFDVPKSLLRGDLWMYPALLYDEFKKIFFIPVIDSWYLMYYIFKSVNVNITFDLNIYWSWWYFRWCHSDNDRPQAYILDTPQRLQSPARPGCCKYLW